MAELSLVKTPSGQLVPTNEMSRELVGKIAMGKVLVGEFRQQRNPRFHAKVICLLRFAFDLWDAPALEYKGIPVAKTFERFRKDITILAGHYEATVNMRGEVRLEAKSISFAKMDEAEFSAYYQTLLAVVWERILSSKGYESAEAVDQIINQLLSYD